MAHSKRNLAQVIVELRSSVFAHKSETRPKLLEQVVACHSVAGFHTCAKILGELLERHRIPRGVNFSDEPLCIELRDAWCSVSNCHWAAFNTDLLKHDSQLLNEILLCHHLLTEISTTQSILVLQEIKEFANGAAAVGNGIPVVTVNAHLCQGLIETIWAKDGVEARPRYPAGGDDGTLRLAQENMNIRLPIFSYLLVVQTQSHTTSSACTYGLKALQKEGYLRYTNAHTKLSRTSAGRKTPRMEIQVCIIHEHRAIDGSCRYPGLGNCHLILILFNPWFWVGSRRPVMYHLDDI
mmetsp:Transcript_83980/g.166765  ORF Transcript_83980/g.166765 Transcript_83980/m.166765 type:complete len:295 (+) Transcript_83980:303-1187(+)